MKLLIVLATTLFSFSAFAIGACPKISGSYICENSEGEKYPLTVIAAKYGENDVNYTFVSGTQIRRFITDSKTHMMSMSGENGFSKRFTKSTCVLGTMVTVTRGVQANDIEFEQMTSRDDLESLMIVRNGNLLARSEGVKYQLDERKEWKKTTVAVTEKCVPRTAVR